MALVMFTLVIMVTGVSVICTGIIATLLMSRRVNWTK